MTSTIVVDRVSEKPIPITVLAITGTIGSGKSAVAELLTQRGVIVVDADILAREVTRKGTPGLAAVAASFGTQYLTAEGNLDRKKLGRLIFSDSNAKSALEAILHPQIRELWLNRLRKLKAEDSNASRFIAYIVPLFFETGIRHPEIDKVVVVAASEHTCAQRIKARDGIGEAEALKKIRAQLPSVEKEKRADFVIRNEGTPEELSAEVDRVLEKLRKA